MMTDRYTLSLNKSKSVEIYKPMEHITTNILKHFLRTMINNTQNIDPVKRKIV
jgi:hypothetical protein